MEEDFKAVWYKRSIEIDEQVMWLEKWAPEFKPDEDSPIVPVWVLLPGLPFHLHTWNYVKQVVAAIGTPLTMDAATENRTRPSMAKVRVEVNLTKTKLTSIFVGTEDENCPQKVEESLEVKENGKIRQNNKIQVEESVDDDNVIESIQQEMENEAEKQGLDKPQEVTDTRMDHPSVEANKQKKFIEAKSGSVLKEKLDRIKRKKKKKPPKKRTKIKISAARKKISNRSVGDREDKEESVIAGQRYTSGNKENTASVKEKQQHPKNNKETEEKEDSQQVGNTNNERDEKESNETNKEEETDQNNSATEEYVADSQEEEKQGSSSRGLVEVGFITSSVDTHTRNQQGIQLFVDLNTENGDDINNTVTDDKDRGEETEDKIGEVNSPRLSEQDLLEFFQEQIGNSLEQAGASPVKKGKGKSKRRSKKRKEDQNKSTL
ncbi:uncharacterized protein LOC132054115 [Lycium ferocissimum]|uniref:uncharacterized protein LOC132054115 n=1 Tax=Lycium ferocissimum TaxID=112874 RepID=UPI002815A508|nr:uncharacterized protein LOC132054115 [Lycium ferocissimum]